MSFADDEEVEADETENQVVMIFYRDRTIPYRYASESEIRDALKKERDRDREGNERSEVKAERLFYFYFLELVFFFNKILLDWTRYCVGL